MLRKFSYTLTIALILSTFLMQSASSTTYTIPDFASNSSPALPAVLNATDILVFSGLGAGGTYQIDVNINAPNGLADVRVEGSTFVNVSNGVNLIVGNINSGITNWHGISAANWNGLAINGSSGTRALYNVTFANLGVATNLGLITTGTSVTVVGCTLTGGRGISITDSSPVIAFNTINASNQGIAFANASPTVYSPQINFNDINGGTTDFFFFNAAANPFRTAYIENNTSSSGPLTVASNANGAVDADPYLVSSPAATPIVINAGTYNRPVATDGPINFYGLSAGIKRYQFNGPMTVANGATLSLGTDFTGATVGNTQLEYNAANTLDFQTGSGLQTFGTVANRSSIKGIASGIGNRGALTFQTGSTVSLLNTDITDGGTNFINTTAFNCNSSRFMNNAVGVDSSALGTATLTWTNCDIQNNTVNLNHNSAGNTLTIENVYWGANPPNVGLFTGTGTVDFEPWLSASGLGANAVTSQPPQNVDANSPVDQSMVVAPLLALKFSATDIGLYNGLPIDYVVEVAQNSTFAPTFERYDPFNRTGLGNLCSAPCTVFGTFSAANYASGLPATYNVASSYPPGTYYYRVRGYDRLGSLTLSTAGGQITPVASVISGVTQFTIGNAQIGVTVSVRNITRNLNPPANIYADAGNYLEYTVSFKNFGLVAAVNPTITNVLPTDVIFVNAVSHNMTVASVLPTFLVSTYSDNAGTTLVGQDNNVQVLNTEQLVNWGVNALTVAEELTVRRISFTLNTLSSGATGYVKYRCRVR